MADQSRSNVSQDGVGGGLEISQEEQSTRLEYPEYFREPQAFQVFGQVMNHQAANDDIEGRLGIGDLLDQPDLENSLRSAVLCLFTSYFDHLGRGVNSVHC